MTNEAMKDKLAGEASFGLSEVRFKRTKKKSGRRNTLPRFNWEKPHSNKNGPKELILAKSGWVQGIRTTWKLFSGEQVESIRPEAVQTWGHEEREPLTEIGRRGKAAI